MKDEVYVALLRGINVGGNNIIRMSALKACFEALGFSRVTTFIQSGNVLFVSLKKDRGALCKKIEKALSNAFGYQACVVLITHSDLRHCVENAPKEFGSNILKYHYDVIFLKEALVAAELVKTIPIKEGVDTVHAGNGVLYFSRLISKATQSRLSKIVLTPAYKSMTIRNWNTTTKLLKLAESVDAG